MSKYTFVVLSNPTPGNETEYNEWYNKVHIPDVLNVPGFVAAQRFRITDAQFGNYAARSHRYLALYEIETDDIKGSLNELQRRLGTSDMVISDGIDLRGVSATVFTPVAERVQAKDVRRPRGAA